MIIETQKELSAHLSSITPINQWKEQEYIKDKSVIEKFWKLCEQAEYIKIIGDYDVDGICSTYILYKSIAEKFPEKDIRLRLPKRITEGYGISRPIINEIHSEFPRNKENALIITVDNGISAGHYLEPLMDEGYNVCILDHHQLADGVNLPQVDLCIDPALDRLVNPFHGDYWCATAVSYFMVRDVISKELAKELETFAGIATVSDCMELKEGNWVLARNAIENVREYNIPDSLKILLKELNQERLDCTEDTFGYYLGPCFNACSRIYDAANRMLNYLISPTNEEAHEIKKINDERKELSKAFTELTIAKVKELGKEKDYPLWLYYPDIPEGIVGIIAGHLAETFECPAIVLTNTDMVDGEGNSIYKGSARSYGEFNIYQHLYASRDKLFKFGGHPGAAGLSVADIYYEELSHIFAEKVPLSIEEQSTPIPIEPASIPSYLNILEMYRPYGQGRAVPTFSMEIDLDQQKDLKKTYMGKQQEHLSIEGPFGKYKILHFYHLDESGENTKEEKSFFMQGKITKSTFRGKTTPNFIADICEPGYVKEKENVEIKDNR